MSRSVDIEFRGLSINSGKVVAPVCLYSAGVQAIPISRTLATDAEVARELDRLNEAIDACSRELDRIAAEVAAKIGATEAEIFVAQKHIMNDAVAIESIRREISEGRRNLEYAIDLVFRRYEEKLANLDNEYLRGRASDVGEIRRRLLDYLYNSRPGFLCQGQDKCARGKDRVIVAQELTAEMMARMRLESVLGIVTEHGGVSSHAAIIARSLGVPAVSGIRGIFAAVQCGAKVLVDGDEGMVVVNPTDTTIRACISAETTSDGAERFLQTPGGAEVLANASLLEDVELAASLKADGIGLFRTEILFLREERLLNEDEQFAYYRSILQRMEGKGVVFRLLDVGGDKEMPFLRIEKETNPSLGWRGARFLLGSPDIFTMQVRALVRLSRLGKVGILIPMVIDSNQLKRIIDGIRAVMATEEIVADNIRIGVMFEVPSACLSADDILRQVDFGSIGSNDLTQYLFAVDRNNELVSGDYNPEHPVLWNVLAAVSEAGRRAGKSISLCGEMAGRRKIPSRLMSIGITSVSVTPRLIPQVRAELAQYFNAAPAAKEGAHA